MSDTFDGPPWPGDTYGKNPCCYLITVVTDNRGYGIPSGGLPKYLIGYGLNGWRIKEINGKLEMVPSAISQTNEYGGKAYLKLHYSKIRANIKAWEAYNAWLDTLVPSAEAVTPASASCQDEQKTAGTPSSTATTVTPEAPKESSPAQKPSGTSAPSRTRHRQERTLSFPKPVRAVDAKE